METCEYHPVADAASVRIERWIFLFALAGAMSVWVAKVLFAIANESSLDHSSGVWINLAVDLTHGLFYRPIYQEDLGFGGTRYFPLFFILHAALIQCGANPVLSGHFLVLFSGVLLLGALFLLMRKLGVDLYAACILSVVPLAAHNIQYTLATIRGDILPVALNLGGFCVFLSRLRSRYREPLTALLFVMAFATKLTAVHGIAAMFLWLLLNGRRREGLRILFLTAAGCGIFLLGLHYSTSGRILTIFQTCSSGGAKWTSLIRTPMMSVRLIQDDTVCVLLWFSAVAILCFRHRAVLTTLPFLFWLVSLGITVMIFGSPGTFVNHLVDLTIASVLFVATSWSPLLGSQRRSAGYLAMIFIVFFTMYFGYGLERQYDQYRRRDDKYSQELITWTKQEEGTILSEDPLIPLMAHKTPVISDAFMLRLILQNDSSLRDMLFRRIRQQEFSAIVFINNPRVSRDWYSHVHLGWDFVQTVQDYYREELWTGRFHIYTPKASRQDASQVDTQDAPRELRLPASASQTRQTGASQDAEKDER